MSNLTEKLLETLQKKDRNAFGELHVEKKGHTYFVTGSLYTSCKTVEKELQKVLEAEDGDAVVFFALTKPSAGVTLSVADEAGEELSWSDSSEPVLDEAKPLFLGMMKPSLLTLHPSYKRMNFETFEKVKNIVTVLQVVAPLIVDKNLRVIDGNLRLEVAQKLGLKQVPVLVVNCEEAKADFLRLVLNRSSEFQRWMYSDVDELVDSIPQAQPLLEPLGFFSNKVLPTTFFGQTVIDYTIDEFNEQMKQYSQDIGLAEWAKVRRAEILAEEERKKARKNAVPSYENRVSLFDLIPSEEDFLPVNDAQGAVKEHVEEMKVVAEGITQAYDAKRKAEKEARGQVWQTSRRTSKKKAADLRAAAEAEDVDADLLDDEVHGTSEDEE